MAILVSKITFFLFLNYFLTSMIAHCGDSFKSLKDGSFAKNVKGSADFSFFSLSFLQTSKQYSIT